MPSILAVQWVGDVSGCVRLIDQTLLPTTLEYRDCRTMEEIWEAIRTLRVRGAPAIGVTAAMGVVLGMRDRVRTSPSGITGWVKSAPTCAAVGRPRSTSSGPWTAWHGSVMRAPRTTPLDQRLRAAARRGPGDPGRGSPDVCGDWGGRGRADPRSQRRADALQHGGAGHGGGTARPWPCWWPRPSQGRRFRRLRRRDAASAPGGPADRVGAARARHRRHPDLRQHGGPGDEGRTDSAGRSSAPIASRPTATPPTRSAPTASPSSPTPTASRSTSPLRPARSTSPWPPATAYRSSSATRAR